MIFSRWIYGLPLIKYFLPNAKIVPVLYGCENFKNLSETIEHFYEDKENPESKDGLVCGLIDPVDLGVNDTNMSNPFSRYHGIQIDDFICGESLSPENHVVWIDVNSPEMIEGTSRVNEGEVKVISHILEKMSLSDSFKEYCNKWIGVHYVRRCNI